MEAQISLTEKRRRLTIYHEMTNIGASEEFINDLVNKSMDKWIKANSDLLEVCSIDISELPEEDLVILMWEFSKLEHYEKAQEIKNFIELRS